MGYTHYWDRPHTISPEAFQTITADFRRLLPALKRAGVILGDAHGYEQPEFTSESVGFNGAVLCGHPRNLAVCVPWPARQARGVGSNQGLAGSTLPHRCCNGDCSYESFWFTRSLQRSSPAGGDRGFCKTAFRPYDLAVTAFLLIAKHHLGDAMLVATDGDAPHWDDARMLCQWELGYGLRYQIDPDRTLCRDETIRD